MVANKLIGTVEGGRLHLVIPTTRETEEQRVANQTARDFIMGAIDMADVRLDQFIRPRVMESIANHVVLRGWSTGRVLLMRGQDGMTTVDVTPWDPRSVVWEIGRRGLSWICHISSMTYAQIQAAHPQVQSYVVRDLHASDRYTVYDFYDQTHNLVFADGLDIKALTPHGDQEIPAYVSFAKGNEEDSNADTDMGIGGLEYMGESCFQSLRMTNDEMNYSMSVRKQAISQEEMRTFILFSGDGSKTFEKSPYRAGETISLSRDDRVEPLDLPQLGKDADNFLTLVSGEEQRGGLPYTAFGNTPISLSGTALQGLRDDYENQATPFVTAAERALQQIANILLRQYKSGRFPPIPIAGQRDEIAPMLIRMADPMKVNLVANYPIDMTTAASTSQILQEGDPLMSKREIRSKILRLPDEVGLQDQINVEQAETLYPTVRFMTAIKSALEMGDPEMAQELMSLYVAAKLELEGQIAMMQMEMAMMGMDQGKEGQTKSIRGGGRKGVSPVAASQPALGMPTPRQAGRSGPVQEPGRPRPGARARNTPMDGR